MTDAPGGGTLHAVSFIRDTMKLQLEAFKEACLEKPLSKSCFFDYVFLINVSLLTDTAGTNKRVFQTPNEVGPSCPSNQNLTTSLATF